MYPRQLNCIHSLSSVTQHQYYMTKLTDGLPLCNLSYNSSELSFENVHSQQVICQNVDF